MKHIKPMYESTKAEYNTKINKIKKPNYNETYKII